MKCTNCGKKLKTVDSRDVKYKNITKRKKICEGCGSVFITLEKIYEEKLPKKKCIECISFSTCEKEEKAKREDMWCWIPKR